MKSRLIIPRQGERTSRHVHGPALALVAIVMAMILGGCIQDHDPRTDSSRIDSQLRDGVSTSLSLGSTRYQTVDLAIGLLR